MSGVYPLAIRINRITLTRFMKFILILAALISIFAITCVDARTFTNSAGRTFDAEVESITGIGDGQRVILNLKNGRRSSLLVSSLSEADQTYIRESKATEAKKVLPSGPSVFKQSLNGKLVKLDGTRISKFQINAEPDYFAFYFSASWCPPCRKFTPKLVEFYETSPAAGEKFELIFVSSDQDEDSMEAYMKEYQMSFPAVNYRYAGMEEVRKYSGSGIPCLVVVNRAGQVVAHSYVGGKYVGPTSVMAKLAELIR